MMILVAEILKMCLTYPMVVVSAAFSFACPTAYRSRFEMQEKEKRKFGSGKNVPCHRLKFVHP
jgi:hypothetical protein